jgi:hypothetical protein
MPEIRSLTAPMIERLNIEVETLDTLEGIDGSTLPDGFGERASTLRLASSIAVEPPPVNLLPIDVTAGRTNRSGRTIVIGGTAAAVAFGAFLYGQASVARTDAERRLDAARREVSSLRTVAAANDARAATAGIQGADSDTPGPVMARVLEAVTNAAPPTVALRSLRGSHDGSQWSVSVNALAAGSDETAAREAGDRVLRELSVLGEPLQPPTIRFLPGTGVELAATYRVRL